MPPAESGGLPLTLAGFAERAADLIPAAAYDYYAGGAGDELTLRDNDAAWRRIALRPRVLVDVSHVETAVRVLGSDLPHPLIVAPMAYLKHADPLGEVAAARGAEAAGATYCLSSFAHTTLAELAAQVPTARRWFQLYVFRDRGITRDAIAAAADAGYSAIVITVDRPVLGTRGRETGKAASFVLPPGESAADLSDLASRHLSALDDTLTWVDVERLIAQSRLPVVLKGILTAADAVRCVETGAQALVVSNHGGRQLDTVLSGADALPAVADAVAGAIDVLVDGGIRRGSDVAKALALGARAVLVGRPVLWGLAAGGEAGVRAVLEILLAELRTTLALVGVPSAADLDRSVIEPGRWPGAV